MKVTEVVEILDLESNFQTLEGQSAISTVLTVYSFVFPRRKTEVIPPAVLRIHSIRSHERWSRELTAVCHGEYTNKDPQHDSQDEELG